MTSIADLEIFAGVVTAGSMSAAGRELDLSPAVVSKRISHLETRLGTRLFHRTTRQLQLTETGRGFYERVGRFWRQFRRLRPSRLPAMSGPADRSGSRRRPVSPVCISPPISVSS